MTNSDSHKKIPTGYQVGKKLDYLGISHYQPVTNKITTPIKNLHYTLFSYALLPENLIASPSESSKGQIITSVNDLAI